PIPRPALVLLLVIQSPIGDAFHDLEYRLRCDVGVGGIGLRAQREAGGQEKDGDNNTGSLGFHGQKGRKSRAESREQNGPTKSISLTPALSHPMGEGEW